MYKIGKENDSVYDYLRNELLLSIKWVLCSYESKPQDFNNSCGPQE